MPLIKIKPELFINSEQVESVTFFRGAASVAMQSGRSYAITEQAASYLLVEMDTRNAVVLPGEPPPDHTEIGTHYGGTDPT